MGTYYDEDKENCPTDRLEFIGCSDCMNVKAVEDGVIAMVDLDYQSVVELQQQLGLWLLEQKENL
jgi:hypothetical protein